ncbi:MAG: alpha/beta hydrolase [Myxococcales bacterium]|nr:alpha/beta hydrolase [Myxococcales bacterium]
MPPKPRLLALASTYVALFIASGCQEPPAPERPLTASPSERAQEACVSRSHRDVPYAGDARTRLDVHLPLVPRDQPVPWVLWVHGGGWAGGNKQSVELFALRQTCRGFAVATIDYRLSFEARFPAPLADLRAALRHLRAHADDYDLDPDKVVVWGASAGGHLAALLALTEGEKAFDRPDDRHRKVSTAVRGVIDWWGPSSFSEFDADFGLRCPQHKCHTCEGSAESRLLGCEVRRCAPRARRASPLTYVKPHAPPFLLQHGRDDCTVPAAQSQRLAEALRAAGNDVQLEIIPGARHGDGAWLRPDVMAAVDGFLDRRLGRAPLSQTPLPVPQAWRAPRVPAQPKTLLR